MKNEKDCRAAVRDFCLQNRLLCPGQPLRLAAAVSGGADSMALLLLLRALQPEFGYTLSACHVNHGLRGAAADRDEVHRFIRNSWDKTVRFNTEDEGTRIGLPYRYTVPSISGAFQEMYYWDTYFTGEGLILDGHVDLARSNAENMLYMVDRFGKMYNAT